MRVILIVTILPLFIVCSKSDIEPATVQKKLSFWKDPLELDTLISVTYTGGLITKLRNDIYVYDISYQNNVVNSIKRLSIPDETIIDERFEFYHSSNRLDSVVRFREYYWGELSKDIYTYDYDDNKVSEIIRLSVQDIGGLGENRFYKLYTFAYQDGNIVETKTHWGYSTSDTNLLETRIYTHDDKNNGFSSLSNISILFEDLRTIVPFNDNNIQTVTVTSGADGTILYDANLTYQYDMEEFPTGVEYRFNSSSTLEFSRNFAYE